MPYRFGIIIISHYYASYINLNVPQTSFPSEIGVPLPSAFAFQTNPFIWQAFLYMKCIGELAVGECISLQYVCSYVKKVYEKADTSVLFAAHMENGSY
ncbi:hypothetical protein ACT7DG_27055 [Bacillus cereus]